MTYKQKIYLFYNLKNSILLLAELWRNHFYIFQRSLKIEIFIRVFFSGFISTSIHNHIRIHMFFLPIG